jgi:2,4-dichlorophenol 6-monooxygenase
VSSTTSTRGDRRGGGRPTPSDDKLHNDHREQGVHLRSSGTATSWSACIAGSGQCSHDQRRAVGSTDQGSARSRVHGSIAFAVGHTNRLCAIPQIRFEPLLKARAEELSPGRIRSGHELTDLQQDEHGVQALIRDNTSGREYMGARRLPHRRGRRAPRASPDRRGVRGARHDHADGVYVSADFARCAPDPDVLIRWIYSPHAAVLVVMVPMGPERWGP